MATYEYVLASPPQDEQARELWLQHAAGFILMEDVRQDALENLPADWTAEERRVAAQAVDAALYSMMKLADGVTGGLRNDHERVDVRLVAQYSRALPGGAKDKETLDFLYGDGACMGIHGWFEGDFGSDPVAVRKSS